jgi:hypothetical protein
MTRLSVSPVQNFIATSLCGPYTSNRVSQPGQTPGFSLSLSLPFLSKLSLSSSQEPWRSLQGDSSIRALSPRRSFAGGSPEFNLGEMYHLYLIWFLGFEFLEPLSWCSFCFSKSSSQGIKLDLLRHRSPSICDSSPEFNPSPVRYPSSIRPLTSFDFGSSKPRIPSTIDEFEPLNRVFPQIHHLGSTLYTSTSFLEEKLYQNHPQNRCQQA